MEVADVVRVAIDPALSLLPARMDSPGARAMLLAIGMQESKFAHRRQFPTGPARGFWQFERGGVRACSGSRCWGVLVAPASRPHAERVLRRLTYPVDVAAAHAALEHNDALAAAFARLLLFTLPERLPRRDEPDEGWRQYLAAWQPGKPHARTWPGYFRRAWEIVST